MFDEIRTSIVIKNVILIVLFSSCAFRKIVLLSFHDHLLTLYADVSFIQYFSAAFLADDAQRSLPCADGLDPADAVWKAGLLVYSFAERILGSSVPTARKVSVLELDA